MLWLYAKNQTEKQRLFAPSYERDRELYVATTKQNNIYGQNDN